MIYDHLSSYMTYLLSRGEVILSKSSALEALGKSDNAVCKSINRQEQKKRLIRLFRGVYLIIPPEYIQLGFVPPELFIDDLMKEKDVSYYVGLLSAASFYGASHQAVQIFQVIVNKRLKPIDLGRTRIVFYYNSRLNDIPVQQQRTERGPLNVSTPEATAFDLLKYIHQSGNLNHVATVLAELSEELNAQQLKKTAPLYSVVYAQRLGYLLEFLGHHNLATGLADYVKGKKPLDAPLRPGKAVVHSKRNPKWHLFINEKVESDL